MMGENMLRFLGSSADGFIHLTPSHAVTIADVHSALL
jgi:hypothetical protein